MSEQIKVGPSGDAGGSEFQIDNAAKNARITQVTIRSGDYIDGITLAWSDGNSEEIGGHGGEVNSVELEKDEYLVGIDGKAGRYVDQITLYTNHRTLGPYGGKGGDLDFSYKVSGNDDGVEVTGLWGRSGDYVDAIGCIFSHAHSRKKDTGNKKNTDNKKEKTTKARKTRSSARSKAA
ncbi:MAG: hypothetical protein COA42_13465 [Alteromonadaceae bacterium]|nr:MAG: hypothetical protein COA42_13465 [Alteromonadaceae bacterium]